MRPAHSLMFALCLISATTTFAQIEVVVGPKEIVKNAKGEVAPGELDTPFAMDFDKAGNMYIVEYHGGRIMCLSPDGKLSHLAGVQRHAGFQDGPAMQATFNLMHNVVVTDSGDLLMSDHTNSRVRRYRMADKTVDTYAGTGEKGFAGDGGPAAAATLNEVISINISPDRKTLTIADIRNRRIRAIDLASNIITTVAGTGKSAVPQDGTMAVDAPLVDPRAAAYDGAGNLYIVERNGNCLRVVRPDGTIYTVAGSGAKGKADGAALQATMNGPKHLAIDAVGNVYIADDMNHLVRKFDPKSNTVSTVLGDGEIKINRPHGVAVHDGWLYVADSWQHRVIRVKL